jgi:hypothetical protein
VVDECAASRPAVEKIRNVEIETLRQELAEEVKSEQ